MPTRNIPSARRHAARSAAALPECVAHFARVVAATALLVLISAFFTLPYALERHPGETGAGRPGEAAPHLS